jgi:hypothetical protein
MKFSNVALVGMALLQLNFSTVMAGTYADRSHENVDIEADPTTLLIKSDVAPGDSWNADIEGEIRNSLGNPVPRAAIVYAGKEYYTDAQGMFSIKKSSTKSDIIVKRAGYRKVVLAPQREFISLALEPIEIKSLYLQTGMLKQGMKNKAFANAMNLIKTTEINALTIDYKDDEGRVSQNLKPFIDDLKTKKVYTIARIVAFKDNNAPRKFKQLALKNKLTGEPWQDKKNVTYLNPYNTEAWDYLIAVSKEAIAIGFDEVQFDYVRFPTDGDLKKIEWSVGEPSSKTRSDAISGFLRKARKEVGALGGFLAADVFGDTAFVPGDSGIGQNIEAIAPYLDYICPMVYPSGYNKNYAGVKDPVNQPGEIVEVSVKRYRLRAEAVNEDVVIRPWLQYFRDYSPAKKTYGEKEYLAQINGSNKAGGSGWLMWNAASNYSTLGFKMKKLFRIN